MKKYILLISLFCYIFCQAETTEKNDTIIIIKDGVAIDISDLKEELKNMKYDCQFNQSEARNMQRHWDSVGVAIANEATKYALMHNGKNFRPNRTERTFTYNSQQQRQPSRIENRTFQDISNIEFSHKYGDIIVQESKSNRVELEIHYFDRQSQTASVVIT